MCPPPLSQPSGGSYMGATEAAGIGIAPLPQIKHDTKRDKGRKTMGLLPRNPAISEDTWFRENSFRDIDVDGQTAAHGQRIVSLNDASEPLTRRCVRAADP